MKCRFDKFLILLSILFYSADIVFNQVVITEVLFDPDCPLSNQEFVEILNLGPDPVDITGWRLADNHSTDDLISDFSWLGVGEYGVILEQDYSGCFDSVFPDEVNFIYVDDNSIGNGLGNTTDMVQIINAEGDTISIVSWTSGITHGHSLEKVVPEYDNLSGNWRVSIAPLGTPGSENSVASHLIDIGVDSLWIAPEHPDDGEPFEIMASITNFGLLPSQTQIRVNDETAAFLWVDSVQTIVSPVIITHRASGVHPFIVSTLTEEDYDPGNDSLSIQVIVSYEYGDMLINEIMYDALIGQPEWVEIVNVSQSAVSSSGWRINDRDNFPAVGISAAASIPVFGFDVVSKDSLFPGSAIQSSFPVLNNTEDQVYLFDPSGKMIDHVFYQSWWGGGDGFSLERITHFLDSNNPENWGTCVSDSGSTSGYQNALFVGEIISEGVITVTPNPFSPDDDGFEDETIISFHVPFTQAYIHAVIYDVRGREIDTLFDQTSAAEGIFRWDGKMTDGYRCKTGQYILVMEATNSFTRSVWKGNSRIIIASHLK